MDSQCRAKAITAFLKSKGDPQPDSSEWKVPAARSIAQNASLSSYQDKSIEEIKAIIDRIRLNLDVINR